MIIIDKTFNIVKKNKLKTFKQGMIEVHIWNDLVLHSSLGTQFCLDDKIFTLRYLDCKITVVDIVEYKQSRKEQVIIQTPTREPPTPKEITQDDSRGIRRLQSFWF